MSYIGKVQIGQFGNQVKIGSTLYGVCGSIEAGDDSNTATKIVTLDGFDNLLDGVTIFVKFLYGNKVTTNMTLAVGSTASIAVRGNCICDIDEVIAFTLEEINGIKYWHSNRMVLEGEILSNANSSLIVNKIGGQTVNLASKNYVDYKTGGLSGLEGALHFKGRVQTDPTQGLSGYENGDVVLYNLKEFVYVQAESTWIELGEEGDFVLTSSQESSQINTITNAGTASNATVSGGVLVLTNSTIPSTTATSVIVPKTSGS